METKMQERWHLGILKADLASRFLVTCNRANLYFCFFVPWPCIGIIVVKSSWFTLFCCRVFYLPLGELWEIIEIKSLLSRCKPVLPFISKNSSLHLSAHTGYSWTECIFPFLLFWVRMRTGIWLSWCNTWWESCCCGILLLPLPVFVAYPVSIWCL